MGNNLSKVTPTHGDLTNRLQDLVYWEELGINLPGIQHSDIQLIKHEPTNVNLENRKQALYDKWLQCCTSANWGDVVQALMIIKQNVLANTILKQLGALPKPTEDELSERLKELVDWEEFALHLPGISQSDIDDIANTTNDLKIRKKNLFAKWLRHYRDASWEQVLSAYEKMAHRNVIPHDTNVNSDIVQTQEASKQADRKVITEDKLLQLKKMELQLQAAEIKKMELQSQERDRLQAAEMKKMELQLQAAEMKKMELQSQERHRLQAAETKKMELQSQERDRLQAAEIKKLELQLQAAEIKKMELQSQERDRLQAAETKKMELQSQERDRLQAAEIKKMELQLQAAEIKKMELQSQERDRLQAAETKKMELQSQERDRLQAAAAEIKIMELQSQERDRLQAAEIKKMELQSQERDRLQAAETKKMELQSQERDRLQAAAAEIKKMELQSQERDRLQAAEIKKMELQSQERDRLQAAEIKKMELQLQVAEIKKMELQSQERDRLQAAETKKMELQSQERVGVVTMTQLGDEIDSSNLSTRNDTESSKRKHDIDVTYSTTMDEGSGVLAQCNIVLHGSPGAGKSSVERIILGQPADSEHEQGASDILERCVRPICVTRVAVNSNKHFEVTNNDDIISRIAAEVERDLETQSGITNTERAIKSKLLNLETAPRGSNFYDSHWLHFINSGGHPKFLDILPLLYRSPSHFIAVMRLTEGLDEKPLVRFYSKGNDEYCLPDHLVLTNGEMIIRMCQIAQSIAQSTGGKFIPRVFVVGTHLDKLGLFSKTKRLQQVNEQLAPIYKKYSDVLICKSANEFIFPINAMATGKERQQYTEELQKHILLATENIDDPIKVPLKWLTFHLELDRGEGVVRMSECLELGNKLRMNEMIVQSALEFLNQAALVLYYPDYLPDLVLTKMAPFTSRLSLLIKASFIPPDDGPAKESILLKEKGVFTKAFLKRVFNDLEDNLLSDEEFLKLLESLKIVVHIGGEEFFLPSALSLEPPCNRSSFDSSSNPLALLWGEVILPHGFFMTAIVELQDTSGREEGCVFELHKGIAQWREEIQLSEAKLKIPGVVKLTNRQRWIQVSYSGDKSYCSRVYRIVVSAIERASKRLQHTGIGSPTIGYLCPLCKEKDHYCYLSEDRRFVSCSINNSKIGPVTEDMFCWLEGTSEESNNIPLSRDDHKQDKGTTLPSSSTIQTTGDHSIVSLSLLPVDDRILQASDIVAILRSIIDIADWISLGLVLGTPYNELEIIKRDGHDERDRQRIMVSMWLDNGTASWKCLVEALLDPLVNRVDIANRISQQHPFNAITN